MFQRYNTDNITILNVLSATVNEDDVGKRIRSCGETAFYQLGIKFKGETSVWYRNKEYVYGDNTVLYLPQEVRRDIPYHKVYRRPGSGVCVFFTSAHPLDTEAKLYKSSRPAVMHDFKEMLRAFKSDNPLRAKSLFYAILSELDESEKSVRCEDMAYALDYFRAHVCDDEADFRALSNRMGVSPDYFRHKFTKEFGMPPQKYIAALKIETAKDRLLNSKLSVRQIASGIGFRDGNYFARFFKKETGFTPLEFRTKFKRYF